MRSEEFLSVDQRDETQGETSRRRQRGLYADPGNVAVRPSIASVGETGPRFTFMLGWMLVDLFFMESGR